MSSADLYPAVGIRIRALRLRRGLNQEQLATLVSLTRTSITNIEQGKQKILLHTLYDIAVALAVPPTTLLPDTSQVVPGDKLDQNLPSDLTPPERAWVRALVTPEIRES